VVAEDNEETHPEMTLDHRRNPEAGAVRQASVPAAAAKGVARLKSTAARGKGRKGKGKGD
jgi:hypothetical protein